MDPTDVPPRRLWGFGVGFLPPPPVLGNKWKEKKAKHTSTVNIPTSGNGYGGYALPLADTSNLQHLYYTITPPQCLPRLP